MIGRILPTEVVAVETRGDIAVDLFPQEREMVERAVEKRRREFTTGRACARQALKRLGLSAVPLVNGEHGAPQWPAGVVGSITHCAGYRACAVAREAAVASIGIDAEPHEALPAGILGSIARPEELPRLRELRAAVPELAPDRLLFCAKEAVYKAWYPLARRWLGFEEATISFEPGNRTFEVSLLAPGLQLGGEPLTALNGRWLAGDGLVIAAIVLRPRSEPETAFR